MTEDFLFPTQLSPFMHLRKHQAEIIGQMVRETALNGVLVLPPGEYMGPVVIDRPMRIQGQGRSSVLWNYESPVIIVTSPGVCIENVLVEITVSGEAQLYYIDGCIPELKDCLPNELRMTAMNPEKVINLGTLLAGAQIELPVLLPSKVGWNRPANKLGNAEFDHLPRTQNTRRGFILRVKPPDDDGYIIETLRLEASSDPSDNTELLIFGKVERKLNAKIPTNPVLKLQDGRQVYLTGPLEITEQQLSFLSGISAEKKGVYGVFCPENGKSWCFWMPYRAPEDVRLNGDKVQSWHRVTLEVGQRFVLGTTELSIEDSNRIPLKFDPVLNLTISDCKSLHINIPFEFNKRLLQIMGSWEGTVASVAPWLQVDSPNLKVTASGQTRSAEVAVTVTEQVAQISNGQYLFRNGLVIYNEHDIMFMDILLNIQIPDCQFMLDPDIIQIMPSDPTAVLYAGELQGLVSQFRITNVGRQINSIEVKSYADWLEVPAKASAFELKSGEYVDVPVRLTASANRIPPGHLDEKKGIRVEEINSKYYRFTGFQAEIQPGRGPQLVVAALSTRSLRYNVSNPAPVSASFTILNQGFTPGVYRVVTPPTIQIDEPTKTLQPGESQECTIQVRSGYLAELREGQHEDIQIEIHGGKEGEALVPVETVVIGLDAVDLFPRLEIQPQQIDIGVYVEGHPVDFATTVTVHNTGLANFSGKILCSHTWLSLSEQKISLKPNEKIPFEVRVNKHIQRLDPGQYILEDAIRIEGDQPLRQPAECAVTLILQAALPMLHPHMDFLWFGQMEQGDAKRPSVDLIVGNYGHAVWRGTAQSNVDWLTVPEGVISIPEGYILSLPVSVNSHLERAPIGAHYVEKAILLLDEKGDQSLTFGARILLTSPQAKLCFEPAYIDFGTITEGVVPAPRHVKLQNQGSLTWHYDPAASQVPDWINIHPVPAELSPAARAVIEIGTDAKIARGNPGAYEDTLYLSDGAYGKALLHVQIEIMPVAIEIQPERLHVYSTARRRMSLVGRQNNVLSITNQGGAPFQLVPYFHGGHGNLLIEEWMVFDPPIQIRELNPQETLSFKVFVEPNSDIEGSQAPIIFHLPNGQRKEIEVVVER